MTSCRRMRSAADYETFPIPPLMPKRTIPGRERSAACGTFRDTVAVCCRHYEQVITQAGVGYARTDPCSGSLIGRRVTEAGRCC